MFQWKRDSMCHDCPFMTSGKGLRLRKTLARGRWQEILNGLKRGEHFLCHQTTHDAVANEDGEEVSYPHGMICAGARAWQAKRNIVSDAEQIMTRLESIKQHNQQGERKHVRTK